MTFKFRSLEDRGDRRYRCGDAYTREVHPDWSRVTISVNEKQIPLMLDIARHWEGPYVILYVLIASRRGHGSGRYQSPTPCSFDDLEIFAYTFQEYLEVDGRHHLWLIDVPTNKQIIYDNHNLLYSYGDDEDVISLLKTKGLVEGNPKIPYPHEHRFNLEYDVAEDEIMEYFEWIKFPLQEEQDDP